MGYGDAYVYGSVLKDENAERVYDLSIQIDDIRDILEEEIGDLYIGSIVGFDLEQVPMMAHHALQLLNYWETERYDLVRDNLALVFLVDDSWLEGWRAAREWTMVYIDTFIEQTGHLTWCSPKLDAFKGHYMRVVNSHYDTHEEWMSEFKVQETR